jgi:hypothetical protein
MSRNILKGLLEQAAWQSKYGELEAYPKLGAGARGCCNERIINARIQAILMDEELPAGARAALAVKALERTLKMEAKRGQVRLGGFSWQNLKVSAETVNAFRSSSYDVGSGKAPYFEAISQLADKIDQTVFSLGAKKNRVRQLREFLVPLRTEIAFSKFQDLVAQATAFRGEVENIKAAASFSADQQTKLQSLEGALRVFSEKITVAEDKIRLGNLISPSEMTKLKGDDLARNMVPFLKDERDASDSRYMIKTPPEILELFRAAAPPSRGPPKGMQEAPASTGPSNAGSGGPSV